MPENSVKSAVDLSMIKVLIAEDNMHMRRVLRALLSGLGAQTIIEADDGVSALARFQGEPVDVLITDWEMPEMNGLELVRQVRNRKLSPDPYLPIIMLSGHASKGRVIEARDSGITEFLCKPISATDLYKRLVNCLANPRRFVQTKSFFGPDRRRFVNPLYKGNERRCDHTSISYSSAQST